MKKKFKRAITIFTFFVFLFCLMLFVIKTEVSSIKREFQEIFERSIWIEMEARMNGSNVFISFSTFPSQESDTIRIDHEGSIKYVEKDSLYKKQSFDQRQRQVFQTILKKEDHPVNIVALDSIYRNNLSEKNRSIKTSVKYIDNENSTIDVSNIILYPHYSTEIVELGIEQNMSVQGYYTLPFTYILWKSRVPLLVILFIWFFIICLVFYLIHYRRKKIKQSVVYVPVKELEPTEEDDVLLKISDSIYYNPLRAEVHYNKENVITLSGQIAVLFGAFVEAPGYFLSNEEVNRVLEWEKIEDTRTRRSQVINRFKETLKPIREITVKNQNRKGYILEIQNRDDE